MMHKGLWNGVLLGLLAAAPSAHGAFEVRLVGSAHELEAGPDEVESEGGGYQLRSHFALGEHFFLRGSVLSEDSDEVDLNGVEVPADLETRVARVGLGYAHVAEAVRLYGSAEYADLELDLEGERAEDDGLLLSGGITDNGEGAFLWEVEYGFLRLSDSDGSTLAFTLGYRFSERFAIVGGGQAYIFDNDDDSETTLGYGSLGMRFSFR